MGVSNFHSYNFLTYFAMYLWYLSQESRKYSCKQRQLCLNFPWKKIHIPIWIRLIEILEFLSIYIYYGSNNFQKLNENIAPLSQKQTQRGIHQETSLLYISNKANWKSFYRYGGIRKRKLVQKIPNKKCVWINLQWELVHSFFIASIFITEKWGKFI